MRQRNGDGRRPNNMLDVGKITPLCKSESLDLDRDGPMILKMWELISIVLLTLVSGMYWGPWLALSRSMATFEPEVFLPVVARMNRNMGPLMIVLMPIALLSTVPVRTITPSPVGYAFGKPTHYAVARRL